MPQFLVQVKREYTIRVEADTRTQAYELARDKIPDIVPHTISMKAYREGDLGDVYVCWYPPDESREAFRKALEQ